MAYAEGFTPITQPSDVPSAPPSGEQGKYAPGFTPILGQDKFSPDEASTALGHSTGLMANLLGQTFNAATTAGGFAGDIGTGIAKGGLQAVRTASGVDTNPVVKGMLANAPAFAQDVQAGKQATQPTNLGQTIGKAGEQTAEYFLPGSAEKSIFAKGGELINKIPGMLGAVGKTAGAITGTLKTALQALTSAGTMGTVAAGQSANNPDQIQNAATLGGIGGVASGVLQAFGPELVQSLNKADFRLTPAKEMSASKIADRAAQFITDNKITGTNATKFTKLQAITGNFETALQSSLPKDVAVPKNDIINQINQSVENLRSTDPSVYNQARTKADEAISLLQSQKGDANFTKGGTISVQDALAGKRSWAQMAFKTSQMSKRNPTVSNEGAFAVEQAYQKSLEDTLSRTDSPIRLPKNMQSMFGGQKEVPLSDFNKVYSSAINAKNLSGIAQYRNDAGLFGRLFGLWVGKSVGQTVMPGLLGEIVGGGIGEIASSHLTGALRNLTERSLVHPGVPEAGAKIIQGASQVQNP